MVNRDSPTFPDDPGLSEPEDWLSAAETRRLALTATMNSYAHIAILKRANAGLIRTRARLVDFGGKVGEDVELPKGFWWAEGGAALEQNWDVGDFATDIDGRHSVRAFGVRFHRDGVRDMIPEAFTTAPTPTTKPESKELGGRRMSALWPEWVAELALYINDEGLPSGQGVQGMEELISTIESRLIQRGLQAPSRSALQDTARAVLRRLRGAGN